MENLKQQRVELRQFLRAISNDQLLGDEITNLLLLEIERDGLYEQTSRSHKKALFSRALARWRQVYDEPDTPAAFTPSAVLKTLSPYENMHHQVSILVDIMEFSQEDAAAILDISQDEVSRLLDLACEERKKPVAGKALIIEDEAVIADEISEVAKAAGVTVVGTVSNRPEALKVAANNQFDLILADYDLGPGGTGLDAVKDITSLQNCIAVFITGFPDEVLTGDDYEPAFVVKKPYDLDAIRAAIYYALGRPRLEMIKDHA